jgi:hypothetical protein
MFASHIRHTRLFAASSAVLLSLVCLTASLSVAFRVDGECTWLALRTGQMGGLVSRGMRHVQSMTTHDGRQRIDALHLGARVVAPKPSADASLLSSAAGTCGGGTVRSPERTGQYAAISRWNGQ